jgi:outer membrane protein OmpA-like peptidoglycan-associated protein
MESVSFGKEKPAITGDTEVAMEKNRRAEMVIR